jgi:hypothetical protein
VHDFKVIERLTIIELSQIVGGADHTLRAKLTFSQEIHGISFGSIDLYFSHINL